MFTQILMHNLTHISNVCETLGYEAVGCNSMQVSIFISENSMVMFNVVCLTFYGLGAKEISILPSQDKAIMITQ